MRKQDLRKNVKAWCWWKSRNLYFTGRVINGNYEFTDINGAITMIDEGQLASLEAKEEVPK
jgi:hypothetical protein